MTDDEAKPDERLEHLLRRWGAGEAARQADVSGLSAPEPGAVRAGWVWRWMPLAASIVLVAGAAALFFVGGPSSLDLAEPAVSRPDPAAETRMETLEAEAAKLRADLAAAGDRLAAMEAELAKTAKVRADLAEAKKQLEKTEEELADAKIQLYGKKKFNRPDRNAAALQAALQKATRDLADERARFRAEIARLSKPAPGAGKTDKEIEALVEKRIGEALKKYKVQLAVEWLAKEKELDELKKQLAAAKGQAKELAARLAKEREAHGDGRSDLLERIRKSEERQDEVREYALSTLREWGGRQRNMLHRLTSIHLSAVAPGKEGYAARQHAARKRHLLKRYAELRPKLNSSEHQKMFDRIEVLLTRLDLLDVRDEAAVKRFRALVDRVHSTGIHGIAGIVADAEPDAGAWALEAVLVLEEWTPVMHR